MMMTRIIGKLYLKIIDLNEILNFIVENFSFQIIYMLKYS